MSGPGWWISGTEGEGWLRLALSAFQKRKQWRLSGFASLALDLHDKGSPCFCATPTIIPRVFTRQGVPVLGLPHWQVLRDRFPLCFRECVDVFVGPGLSTGYWPNATALRRCYRRAPLSEPVRVSIHAAHDHIMFKELPRRYVKDRKKPCRLWWS